MKRTVFDAVVDVIYNTAKPEWHGGLFTTLGLDQDMELDALHARLAITDDDLAVLERARTCEWEQAATYWGEQILAWILTGEGP